MFNRDISDSDEFLDMPASTQLYYFHLGMAADDDGFVGSPRSVSRKCNAGQDDFKILLTKRFVLGFEDGVIVIKAWRMNNNMRRQTYKMTKYTEHRSRLLIKPNGSYTRDKEQGVPLPDGYFSLDSIDIKKGAHGVRTRVDKTRLDKSSVVAPHASISYLREIPDADMKEFVGRFAVGEVQIKKKAEQFRLYCESAGKTYKNYKSALLNAMIKDFEERTEDEKKVPVCRPKLHADGSPVINPDTGGIVMETV